MLWVVFGNKMIESTPENITSQRNVYLEYRTNTCYKSYDDIPAFMLFNIRLRI